LRFKTTVIIIANSSGALGEKVVCKLIADITSGIGRREMERI